MMTEPLFAEEMLGDSDADSCDEEDKTVGNDRDISTSTDISEELADYLYDRAGTKSVGEQTGTSTSTMIVAPNPKIMFTSEKNMILEAKEKLRVDFVLEQFQVQALLGRIINILSYSYILT